MQIRNDSVERGANPRRTDWARDRDACVKRKLLSVLLMPIHNLDGRRGGWKRAWIAVTVPSSLCYAFYCFFPSSPSVPAHSRC